MNTRTKILIEIGGGLQLVEMTGEPIHLLTELTALFCRNEEVMYLMKNAIKLTEVIEKDAEGLKANIKSSEAFKKSGFQPSAEGHAIIDEFLERYKKRYDKKN